MTPKPFLRCFIRAPPNGGKESLTVAIVVPFSDQACPTAELSDQLSQFLNSLGKSVGELLASLTAQHDIQPQTTHAEPTRTTVWPITHLATDTDNAPSTTTFVSSLFKSSSLMDSSPSAPYVFDPQASNLNVVYYSQTDLTSIVSLEQICGDDAIDVVIIAFVTQLYGAGGYPAMNMASNCWAPTTTQEAAGATELLDCVGDGFAENIARCQDKGKKVLLSLGGSVGNLSISSAEQAVDAAHTLWNLFLGGTDAALESLRPYGTIVFDGIDLDNESPADATYLPVLVSTLHTLLATDTSKTYYITAAPQCPRPDASIPVSQLLPYVDFFSVQFFNNPSCQLSAGRGFFDSLQAWSDDLLAVVPSRDTAKLRPRSASRRRSDVNAKTGRSATFEAINNGVTAPRLLIGTPAFAGAGSGYVGVTDYKSLLEEVKAMRLPNLAGAMFWDGAYQETSAQVIPGLSKNVTFAEVVRMVLV